MASPSASVAGPAPPLPNKRAQGIIGTDLIVTFHSDLAQCQILPPGSRYMNAGNFKAGVLLPFNPPAFVFDLYPRLLSADAGENTGIPLLLSMFSAGVRTAAIEDDWEGKWFTIVARLCPNKLNFHGMTVDGWETDAQPVQTALALPRDGGLTPYNPLVALCSLNHSYSPSDSIVPRLLADSDGSAPWPDSSARASFAGPVDLDTFHINEDIWPDTLRKTSVFVKLGSYLLPENDRPPHKGVHIYHVLLLFPLEQQPWSSLLGWMKQAANPFPKGSWIVCSGRILGVLNRDLVRGPQVVDPAVRILVILPDDWEFIRQNVLSGTNTASASPNPVNGSAAPTGPGGVVSRNPYSSPSRKQVSTPQKRVAGVSQTPSPSRQSTTVQTSLGEEPTSHTVTVAADQHSITAASSMSLCFYTYHIS